MARVMTTLGSRGFHFSWGGFGPVREALVERAGSGVEIHPVRRHPRGGIELRLVLSIARLIRRYAPHVVHVHNWSTSLYGILGAHLAGVPAVVYGLGGGTTADVPTLRRRRAMRALGLLVDRFTTVCAYLANDLRTYWQVSDDRISILKTGIDLTENRPRPNREEILKKYEIPLNASVVGTVTVIRPVKRIPDLIEAAGRLAESHPNLFLLLAGNPVGVRLDDLRRDAERAGLGRRFLALGRIEDAREILAAFDVFVNCSEFEGTSNAILEAMAAERPVVATDVGGSPELVEHERTGLLVPPRAPGALAQALDRLLRDADEARRLGEAGRKKVESDHTIESMAGAHETLYARLADQAPDPTLFARAGSILRRL